MSYHRAVPKDLGFHNSKEGRNQLIQRKFTCRVLIAGEKLYTNRPSANPVCYSKIRHIRLPAPVGVLKITCHYGS